MYWEASAAKCFKTNSFLLTLLVLGTAELTRLLVTGFGAAQGDKCSKFNLNAGSQKTSVPIIVSFF